MKTKHFSMKSVISMLLALVMIAGTIPVSVFAAQSNDYVDPADSWLSSNNRTNELDVNATVTNETQYCSVCEKDTVFITYRVPEYTKTGGTALNRGVKYSDGTCIDGVSKGNLDNGAPGVDAYYTGYHFTKSVCQTCGTINSIDGPGDYSFNNNIYTLNSCDHNFFLDFDNTTYEPYDASRHLTTLKRGEYCKFCKGTFARASKGLENHDFTESVDAQLGNNRFYVAEKCEDCGYETNEYVTAKSVVASYYGTADGEAHTLTVSDMSDSGVKTSIRYGDSADNCNRTSAPNYTQPGYYTVYYKINYSYAGETMTENGVSYVWLVNDDKENGSNDGNTIIVIPPAHEHDYHYLETVAPNCENLGYDRFQCSGCGDLIKTNYTQSTGHSYKTVTIREANYKQGGLKLHMCDKCGNFYEETTPLAAHSYKTVKHNPTCKMTGYTEHICEVCGDNYITDITPLISHSYESITKAPTCTDKGYTTRICTMCNESYVSDYTESTGHHWDEGHIVTGSTCTGEGVIEHHCLNDGCTEKMIKATSATGHTPGAAATCTEPQICEKCGTVLELPKGHHYDSEVVAPTCTSMGYTVYTCHNCDDTYTGDYTGKADHDYNSIVTAPTCTSHGYTTYSCKKCDDEYVSGYTEKLAHNYKEDLTEPTCTSMGFSTFTCADCGDSYVGNYTDMTEHNYNREIIEPTCTEHGYAVYTCPDCGKSYIGDYTDCKEHHYTETVVAPTCTEMGYSIFKCDDCGDEYKGNYTDKAPHSYEETVTEPTCLELGFSTFACSVCGDTYKSNYMEVLGHQPSEWIIDTPATIENAGSKHIECERCGEILQSVEIPQLIDTDNSDEDGSAQVGDYSIILTDKDGKPIFNSEITIDINDNVTIKLPSGRLLDYADQTTITAFYTDTQKAAQDLRIFIFDKNNNAATGATNENGQLKVPNNQSSTGDDNGTIGGDDGEEKITFVVTVTDKTNVVIPNCDIHIGESNNIVVDLPDGIKPTRENPVIVTVTDHNGNAQRDTTVIAIGDADFMEKGSTDMYGKITLPTASEGFTDKDGKVNVDNINVIVNDEISVIPNAYVKHNEDNSISVTLPEDKTISYANRITITILESIGNAMPDITVTVNDVAEMTYTANTDENGRATVPPIHIDYTDVNGYSEVDGYVVTVVSEIEAIENAYVQHNAEIKNEDGTVKTAENISVILPENVKFDYANRITVTVLNKADKTAVKDMEVAISEFAQENMEVKTLNGKTNANGKVTLPVKSSGGGGGSSRPSGGGGGGSYISNTTNIIVTDKEGKTVSVSKSTDSKGNITLTLPNGKELTNGNYYTVKATDSKGNAKFEVNITLKDKKNNSANGITDKSGVLVLPAKEHKAYIVGYDDGTFRPDSDMTRSEAAAIFARLISEEKGESIGGKSSFADVSNKEWYYSYIGYLEKYNIIKGYSDKTFRPDETVTRAEFVSMAVRYYSLFNDVQKSGYTVQYTDLAKDYWAYADVAYAKHIGWLNGYADGTFRGDSNITRAEVVTVVNRATGRTADKEYIRDNFTKLNRFTDVTDSSLWYFFDVAESCNDHKAVTSANSEVWGK